MRLLAIPPLLLLFGCGGASDPTQRCPSGCASPSPTPSPSPSPTPSPTAEPQTLGSPCESDAGCGQGFCLEDPTTAEKYCSMRCEGPCPSGYRCDVLNPELAACRKAPAQVEPSAEITTGSKDGVFGYGPSGLRIGWDYARTDVERWDFYHGSSADPPLYAADLTAREARVAKQDLSDGTRFYWKVVGHTASGVIASEVWSYQAKQDAIQGPCADQPSVEVDGAMIDTVEVLGRCWLSHDLTRGIDDTGSLLDDGRVQRTCMNPTCTTAVYSWWEAHNTYESRPDLVGADICPSGYRLPTRVEWDELLALGVGGLRFSPFFLELRGHLAPQTGAYDSCPDPDHPGQQIACVQMGSIRDTSSGYYWVNQSSSTTATRVVITHEGGGNYTVSYSTPRPTFTAAVRCVRD